MISNARKAHVYGRMADEVRRGWTKQALSNADGVCLVGAVDRVTFTAVESHAIQMDLAEELYRTSPLVRAMLDNARVRRHYFNGDGVTSLYHRSNDGGMAVLEGWNDVPYRRRSQVVALLERMRDIHANLARLDRAEELEDTIAGLRAQIETLRARVAHLEAENARLTDEVTFWKARRARVTAKQLVRSSTELAELDADLDAAARELAGLSYT